LANRCVHIKEDGHQCGSHPPKGKSFCLFHDPDRAEEAMAARAKGGRKGVVDSLADIKPPRTEPEVLELLSQVTAWVVAGKCDSKRADTIVKCCKTQLQTIKQQRAQMPERSDDDLARMTDAELVEEMRDFIARWEEEEKGQQS
jgi:hypothetical protein